MGPLLVEVRSVFFAVMYLLLRRLVRLLANSSKDLNGDVEVVVLRHQLMVLSATWPSASSPSRPPRAGRGNNLFPAIVARGTGDVRIAWQDDRNGFDAGGDDEGARWNTYYRSSTDGGTAWSPEVKLSAFVPGYGYKFAEPMDGYLEPYGDYFELDIDGRGTTHALWG